MSLKFLSNKKIYSRYHMMFEGSCLIFQVLSFTNCFVKFRVLSWHEITCYFVKEDILTNNIYARLRRILHICSKNFCTHNITILGKYLYLLEGFLFIAYKKEKSDNFFKEMFKRVLGRNNLTRSEKKCFDAFWKEVVFCHCLHVL